MVSGTEHSVGKRENECWKEVIKPTNNSINICPISQNSLRVGESLWRESCGGFLKKIFYFGHIVKGMSEININYFYILKHIEIANVAQYVCIY